MGFLIGFMIGCLFISFIWFIVEKYFVGDRTVIFNDKKKGGKIENKTRKT